MRRHHVVGLILALCAFASAAAPVQTLRVDIRHSGDAKAEHYALDRVVVEPLPWPGNSARTIDDTNRGAQKFEVVDAASGKLLYSRGYGTVFGEWRTTAQANGTQRSFQESLRFPMPAGPVRVTVYGRSALKAFVPQWSVQVDPAAMDVQRVVAPAPAVPIAITHHGDPADKVDLLLLGDGYRADRDGRSSRPTHAGWLTGCSA